MTLHPCTTCRRHFDARATSCPFCASAQQGAAGRAALATVARLSRAAVFAGAAACYTGPTTPTTTTTTVPPSGSAQFAAPAEPPAPAAGMATLHGVVTRDGRPLAGAHVRASNEQGVKVDTTSGTLGEFVFKDLAPGRWTVDVDEDDYDPYRYSRRPQDGPPPRPPSPVVELHADHIARQDIPLYSPPVPEPDTGPCCKPYGAPPARRRVV